MRTVHAKEALAEAFTDDRRIRVLIVDPDVDRRWWLRQSLEKDPERYVCVGEAEGGEKAVWWAEWTQPDLVVIDEGLLDDGATASLPALRRVLPEAHLVVHCATIDGTVVEATRRTGGDACVAKGGPPAAFRRALRAVLDRAAAGTERMEAVP